MEDGKVALLDYGITGRLDEKRRLAFLRLLMGGSMNDLDVQLGALRDLGALPDDVDLKQLIVELGLDQPAIDPTQIDPDELMAQLKEVTKALLGYGARMPKELMLFVKNMLFLSSVIGTMAPDVDLFGEIMHISGYFASKHGERIAADVGIDPREHKPDLAGMKASMGITDDREIDHDARARGAPPHHPRAHAGASQDQALTPPFCHRRDRRRRGARRTFPIVPPARPVPDVRLSFDEAAVLLALLELLPDDPDAPELAPLRDRWRERLRTRHGRQRQRRLRARLTIAAANRSVAAVGPDARNRSGSIGSTEDARRAHGHRGRDRPARRRAPRRTDARARRRRRRPPLARPQTARLPRRRRTSPTASP